MMITIFGFISVVFGLALAQAIKVGFSGPISTYSSVALLPGLAVALYAIYAELGWWVIGVFIGLSLLVGMFHGAAIRNQGKGYLLNMQPLYGIIFVIASGSCAALLFYS